MRSSLLIGWIIGVLAVVLILFLIGSADSFQYCIHNHKTYDAYNALHESAGLLIKIFARLRLNGACTRVTVGKNDGAITALASVVVAGFTGTLWWSTRSQLIHLGESIGLAKQEFVASHRPRIAIREVSLHRLGGTVDGDPFIIRFNVVNVGDGPCVIVESGLSVEWRDTVQRIAGVPYEGRNDVQNIRLVAGEAVQREHTSGLVTWTGKAEKAFDDIRLGTFFVGHIIYADDAGVRRHMAFRRRYFHEDGSFRWADHTDFEYSD